MYVRLSNRPFARMEQLSSHWTNFMIFDILGLLENMSRELKFH